MPEKVTLPIETDRLVLRSFVDSDIDDLAALLFGDPLVLHSLPGDAKTPPDPIGRARQRVDAYRTSRAVLGCGGLAVCLRPNGHSDEPQLIGYCGLTASELRPREGELGYALTSAHWNHGLATEACRGLLQQVFSAAAIESVCAVTNRTRNPASIRVLEKLGMTYEGEVDLWDSVQLGYGLLALYRLEAGARSMPRLVERCP